MLLSIGKPMVDLVVEIDKKFLSRYCLSANGARQASEKEKYIFKDILELNPKFLLGGSVTNTLRVFKWVSRSVGDAFYIGLTGKDRLGSLIKDQLDKEKINFHFFEQATTVQCAVLVSDNGKCRSLVTNSLLLSDNTGEICFELSVDLKEKIDSCTFFYVPTFSLGSFSKQVKEISEDFRIKKKKMIVNLGATYILQKYEANSIYLFKVADVVIGNEEEYRTLAKICNIFQNDTLDLDDLICKILSVNGDDGKKVLIITRGSEQVIAYFDSKVKYYPVEKVEDVVDTTGAGDAFAGGFLTGYVKEAHLDNCINCGISCARQIIQVYGCDFDFTKDVKFDELNKD